MAVDENGFQAELARDFKRIGCHSFKAAHRDKVGVSDLYLRTEQDAFWVECKFFTAQPSFRTKKISPSHHQISFMGKELEAGGSAATVIGYRRKTVGHDVHGLFICNPRVRDIQVDKSWFSRKTCPGHIIKMRGKNWPAEVIIKRLFLMNRGSIPWMDSELGESIAA